MIIDLPQQKNKNDYQSETYQLETDYQKYIHLSRYSRWIEKEKRRETWEETVERYFSFFKQHLKENNGFVFDEEELSKYKNMLLRLKIVPSMRCLATAGPALKRDNMAGYNCAALKFDKIKNFSVLFYVLLCGTGCGFSVEQHNINKLPKIKKLSKIKNTINKIKQKNKYFVIKDSKIGWCDALNHLIENLYNGISPNYNFSKIRKQGERLKIFGGRASGSKPLKELFSFVKTIFLNASGRKLSSLEVHDIACKIAEIVVVGGVRRSAMISLSDLHDKDMSTAKYGDWYLLNPQRTLSNNSVAYKKKPHLGEFLKEFAILYESQSGERGIFNRDAIKIKITKTVRKLIEDFLINPCSEIILRPDECCNLSEVIIRPTDTLEVILEKIEAATLFGTMQSTLTNFRYVPSTWKENCEEERLLGVSLTGIMDHLIFSNKDFENNKKWFCDNKFDSLPELLSYLQNEVVEINKKYAKAFNINESVSTTCIKPSGCTTPDTQIKTNKGIMSLHDIFTSCSTHYDETQDKIWYMVDTDIKVIDENNEEQKINQLFVNGLSPVFEITTSGGKKYKFTPEHKLKQYTNSRMVWTKIEDLKKYDNIATYVNGMLIHTQISNIEYFENPVLTVDLEIDKTNTYQLANGMVSHNTVSQLANCSSGIHARFAKYYIRTVRSSKNDALTKFMCDSGIKYETDKFNDEAVVFYFPIKSPENSIVTSDLSAIEQLELWKIYDEYWCTHKPSVTISVKEDEWLVVADWCYKNFDSLSGVSFFPDIDHIYEQAPYTEISEDEYNDFLKNEHTSINWEKFVEVEDNTTASQEYACAGGKCEI